MKNRHNYHLTRHTPEWLGSNIWCWSVWGVWKREERGKRGKFRKKEKIKGGLEDIWIAWNCFENTTLSSWGMTNLDFVFNWHSLLLLRKLLIFQLKISFRVTYCKHAFWFVFNPSLLLELQCKYAPCFPLHLPHYIHFKVFSVKCLPRHHRIYVSSLPWFWVWQWKCSY